MCRVEAFPRCCCLSVDIDIAWAHVHAPSCCLAFVFQNQVAPDRRLTTLARERWPKP